MNIKEASLITGISRDMLRHYEKLGIIAPVHNPKNGYRDYSITDLNNAVMVKQYNHLGLSLQTLSKLSRHGNINTALSEFEQSITQLETELEFSQSKLAIIRDLHDLFSLMEQDDISESGIRPVTYYYPRVKEDSYVSDLGPSLYGAVRSVFRIEQKNILLDPYPTDQGFLSYQIIRSYPAPYIEIPAHRYWRTVIEEERDGIMNPAKLLPILQKMEEGGKNQLMGNVMLTQIMSANEYNPNKIICIECDIGPA